MAHPNEMLVREGSLRPSVAAISTHYKTEYCAEDIRFHFAGRSPFGGAAEGVTQFLEYAGRLAEFTGGTLRLELHDVTANDERAMALLTAHAERAGRKLEENVVQVIGVRAASGVRSGSIGLICIQSMSSSRNAITQAIDGDLNAAWLRSWPPGAQLREDRARPGEGGRE